MHTYTSTFKHQNSFSPYTSMHDILAITMFLRLASHYMSKYTHMSLFFLLLFQYSFPPILVCMHDILIGFNNDGSWKVMACKVYYH